MKNTAVIILAAGKGERMKSSIPKVLHPVCGRPMIEYVLDLAKSQKPKKTIVVLGFKSQEVRNSLPSGAAAVIQKKVSGTADAVKTALGSLKSFSGNIVVLYGDVPLLKKETLDKLLKRHNESNADATIITVQSKNPSGYGRIIRDKYSSVQSIVEDKDTDDFDKDIKEVNTGIICFKKKQLEFAIKHVKANNRKKEFYLTDVIDILYKNECLIENITISDIDEAMGINSQAELSKANSIMQKKINDGFMKEGVTIVDPSSTFISFGAKIKEDTVIYPFTLIGKDVKIGKHCHIGPFVHLRDGTQLEDGVTAGNFLEVTRSKISSKTFAKHFSYIGDSQIGKNVNIGAGTVTANFDGQKKHKTIIEDNVKIGSDTVLVAPVKVGKAAVTGAGSVIIKDVLKGSTVVGVPARPVNKKVN